MPIQSHFLRFHEAIKLNNIDENTTLRDKRDVLLRILRERSPSTFVPFNQGSYAMNTGVQPVDNQYHLDVGVVFKGQPHAVRPETVKAVVFTALEGYTPRVEWRNPCITVVYRKSDETSYHVNLPVYLEDASGQLHLALGKQQAEPGARVWQTGDPRVFIHRLRDRHSGEEALQMRRVIRYLKRWKDIHFLPETQRSPIGLGLTVAAYHWFQPSRSWNARGAGDYDDLMALRQLVRQMTSAFQSQRRLELKMPVAPYDDVLRRMTEPQMLELKERLEALQHGLERVQQTGQLETLIQVFGKDFGR